MEEAILFLLCFIFVFIMYQLFLIRPSKKKKRKDKELLEIKYLVAKYNIDLDKIKYNQLLQICAITSSFDISVCVSLIFLFNNLLMELIFGFISIGILIFISYHLVYLFYKRKGMIKNGKHK